MGWLKRRHERIQTSEAAAQQSERIADQVEAQWPEVHERVRFAREQRRRNHLTELFMQRREGRA